VIAARGTVNFSGYRAAARLNGSAGATAVEAPLAGAWATDEVVWDRLSTEMPDVRLPQ
jgi:hypothetical protein